MIPEKVKSIIGSCATIPQLDTCQHWAEYLYGHNDESYRACMDAIEIRTKQLALCGKVSTYTPEFINSVHIPD